MNIEHQSTLARLLAKENITVTHGNMRTAYFDAKNRVLGLPVWKDKTKDVYDMLTGHEVGHALYTPADSVERLREKCGNIPFDVCNIVEDIRIERLVQATYPGLPRVFKTAYESLVASDFFGIKDKDIEKLKFLDRLNLRGKVGTIYDIPLDADEEKIYQKCIAAETFDDVLDICLEIKEFLEKEPEPETEPESNDSDSDEREDDDGTESESGDSDEREDDDGTESESGDSDEREDDDGTESESDDSDEREDDDEENSTPASSENIKSESEKEEPSNDSSDSEGTSEQEIVEAQDMVSETLRSFDSKLESEVENPSSKGITNVMLPRRSYIYDSIVTYDKLREGRREKYLEFEKSSIAAVVKENFFEFRKKTNKKVGTLVREFEQRKAAYQYSRASESTTGKLDVNKLHNYKLTEEIFLSQTKLANSKSHGMIFLIDYSGSMSAVIQDVIDQTLNLVTFCKKVGIPFRVYSFTSAWCGSKNPSTMTATINEVNLNKVILVEHITSEMSKTTFEEAFFQMWLNRRGSLSDYDKLAGTPLNNALTMMPTIIRDFMKKNSVQKMNFVTLTDGASTSLSTTHQHSESTMNITIKDGGKVHKFKRYEATEGLLEIVSSIPNVNNIGFFIPADPRHANNNLRYDRNLKNMYKKNGFVELDKPGYDTYYLLNYDLSIEDGDFQTTISGNISDSKKDQNRLAKEFGNHNIKARQTRVLLTNLAEKIA